MGTLLISGAVLAVYMSVLFVLSLVYKNNGIADVGYGFAFIVLIIAELTSLGSAPVSICTSVLVLCVFIWGTRLARRIYLKNLHKPEDFRYKAWREAWGSAFMVRSFLQIYMLQGFIAFIVALPVTLSIVFPSAEPIVPLCMFGFMLWIIGFVFEAVGDHQLDVFLKDPVHKGSIMTRGLWHYSRHPNYFGESLMWWGIAIAAAGASAYPMVGFISPVLITFLLLRVSGVPMLEKRWEGNPAWEEYKAKTSVFIPLPASFTAFFTGKKSQ